VTGSFATYSLASLRQCQWVASAGYNSGREREQLMVLHQIERVRSAVAGRARSRVRRMRSRASKSRRPAILMYHRIADEKFDPWGLCVAPDRFADQLSWLAKNRAPIPLPEFAELHRRGALPDDAVAVTFDDGYACTAKIAAPLLERHDVPATIFIPAALTGSTCLFWWDELRQIVMTHPDASIGARGRIFELGERQIRDPAWPRDSRKRTPRQKGFYALWSELQPLPLEDIEQAMAELRRDQPPVAPDDDLRLMTAEEIRSIRSDKIQFGSHALTHVSLPSLGGPEKAHEIRESVAVCEQLVGARPVSFAYPFGDFDRECETLVAAAGFACACTVEPRAVAADDDPFALPRLKIGNWTGRQLGQELADVSCERETVAIGA
jgi:peptidoglycan/xylan/chitin deacetylase (PgdA/CDA1 family)